MKPYRSTLNLHDQHNTSCYYNDSVQISSGRSVNCDSNVDALYSPMTQLGRGSSDQQAQEVGELSCEFQSSVHEDGVQSGVFSHILPINTEHTDGQ